MKLFIASDIHGSEAATKELITAFLESGASQLILLGDLLNHGPRNPIPESYNPVAVSEILNQYADRIIAVRGNCDSEVDQMLLNFPIMSDLAWVLLEDGRRLVLTHGHVYHAAQLPPVSRQDVLMHGHTHIPVAEHIESCYLFNPGSVTFPRNGFSPSYGILDCKQLSVLTFEGEVLRSVDLA
ncbi:phosphodiesterase [Vibrio sp. RC27]